VLLYSCGTGHTNTHTTISSVQSVWTVLLYSYIVQLAIAWVIMSLNVMAEIIMHQIVPSDCKRNCLTDII
jgi:hypothetical protein